MLATYTNWLGQMNAPLTLCSAAAAAQAVGAQAGKCPRAPRSAADSAAAAAAEQLIDSSAHRHRRAVRARQADS